MPGGEKKVKPSLQAKRAKRALQKKNGKIKVAKVEGSDKVANIMTVKQIKRDVRIQTPEEVRLDLKNQQKQIVVQVPFAVASLEGIAAAYVAAALQRGFAGFAFNAYDPYFASVYMTTILRSYAGGQVIPVPQMPYWLLCLCQALSPKIVPFKQGSVAYAFKLDDPEFVGAQPQGPIGYIPYGYLFTLGVPDASAEVNGFPIVNTSSFPGYTEAQGQQSFQTLILFMQEFSANKNGNVKNPPSSLVPSTVVTPFAKNVSAFAVTRDREGLGFLNTGGWFGRAELEVPNLVPVLSLIGQSSTTGSAVQNRFYKTSSTIAGDTLWLSTYMATLSTKPQWKARLFPKFKPVDFLEFADVLAQWVKAIVGQYMGDPETVQNIAATPNAEEGKVRGIAEWPYPTLKDIRCPLTLLETQLCLRNVMMAAFKDTQPGVQSLLPYTPNSSVDNQFAPFTCSANTCSLAALDMMLPVGLVENIRALVARKKEMSSHKDVQWWVPVLGQYVNEQLDSDDYAVTTQRPQGLVTDTITFNVFQEGAFMQHVSKDKTGKEVVKPLSEVQVSLIDGGAGTNLLCINDPMRLKQLVGLWNEWLTTTPLQSYSMTLTQLSTELGICSLTSIAMTRHWVAPTPSIKKSMTEFKDVRIKDRRDLVATPYAAKLAIADTSQSVILAVPYEEVLNTWILPINHNFSGQNIDQQTEFTRWQEAMDEPFTAATTSSDDGEIIAFLHLSYATKMTKARNGAPNQWDQFFVDEAKKGRGGILSGIGGILDGLIGGI